MNLKFHKENFKLALLFALVILIFVPVIMTLFNPSVSEAVYEDYGKCNRYYGYVYIPCITLKEAFILNIGISAVFSVFAFVSFMFLDLKEDRK